MKERIPPLKWGIKKELIKMNKEALEGIEFVDMFYFVKVLESY